MNPAISRHILAIQDDAAALESVATKSYNTFLDEITGCLQVDKSKRRNAGTISQNLHQSAMHLAKSKPLQRELHGVIPDSGGGDRDTLSTASFSNTP